MTPDILYQQQTEAEKLNLEFIGRIISARFSDSMTYDREAFHRAMTRNGVPMEFAPCIGDRNTFIRGLRTLEENSLVEKVREDKDAVVFQATERIFDLDHDKIDYNPQATISYFKQDGRVDSTDPEFLSLIVRQISRERDQYNGSDLRRLFARILTRAGHSIIVRPGTHFLPETHAQWAHVALGMAYDMGIRDTFEWPLVDIKAVRDQIADNFVEQSKKAIRDLEKEISDLQQKGAKAEVLARRLGKIEELRNKCLLYSDTLKFQGTEIENKLASLNGHLRTALTLAP